jgi:hypothetical protein
MDRGSWDEPGQPLSRCGKALVDADSKRRPALPSGGLSLLRFICRYWQFSDVPGRPDDVRSREEERKWSADGQNDAMDPRLTPTFSKARRSEFGALSLRAARRTFRRTCALKAISLRMLLIILRKVYGAR